MRRFLTFNFEINEIKLRFLTYSIEAVHLTLLKFRNIPSSWHESITTAATINFPFVSKSNIQRRHSRH